MPASTRVNAHLSWVDGPRQRHRVRQTAGKARVTPVTPAIVGVQAGLVGAGCFARGAVPAGRGRPDARYAVALEK